MKVGHVVRALGRVKAEFSSRTVDCLMIAVDRVGVARGASLPISSRSVDAIEGRDAPPVLFDIVECFRCPQV